MESSSYDDSDDEEDSDFGDTDIESDAECKIYTSMNIFFHVLDIFILHNFRFLTYCIIDIKYLLLK